MGACTGSFNQAFVWEWGCSLLDFVFWDSKLPSCLHWVIQSGFCVGVEMFLVGFCVLRFQIALYLLGPADIHKNGDWFKDESWSCCTLSKGKWGYVIGPRGGDPLITTQPKPDIQCCPFSQYNAVNTVITIHPIPSVDTVQPILQSTPPMQRGTFNPNIQSINPNQTNPRHAFNRMWLCYSTVD